MLRHALLTAGLLVLATGPASAQSPRRQKGDLAIQARAVLRKYCAECHAPGSARSSLSVVDHNQLVDRRPPVPFVNLDDPSGPSQVVQFLEDGSMPPGGRARPTQQEIDAVKAWVAAKAPSYPRAFDDATTLAVMLDDLDRQKPDDVPHLRYLSLAHLVRDDGADPLAAAAAIGPAEGKLPRALLAGSGKRPPPPEPVDDTATLFRLDLRTVGWDTPDLFDRVVKGQPRPDAYPMVPFDLLLLDYPYAAAGPGKDPRLQSFLGRAGQLRPVPFLRADWVGDVLAPNSPLADDLKAVVDLADARAKGAKDPCGPAPRPFAGAKPLKLPAADGRPPLLPLSAWSAGDVTPDPDPYGLKVEAVLPMKRNMVTTEVEVDEPFRLRVTADRAVRFVVLNVLATGEVRPQPVERDFVKAGEPFLLGPAAGKTFSSGGVLTGGDSEVEHFVLVAVPGDVAPPAPTIVRSRHADDDTCRKAGKAPVWRFVFDSQADAFDPARAVRKVVPITVKPKKR